MSILPAKYNRPTCGQVEIEPRLKTEPICFQRPILARANLQIKIILDSSDQNKSVC